MSSSPSFVSAPKTPAAQIVNADGTNYKTLMTAGASGSRVDLGSIVNSDAANAYVLKVAIKIGSTDYPLGEVLIPAGAGSNGSTKAVSLLNTTDLPQLYNSVKPEPMVEPACPPPTTRGVIDTKVAFYIPPKRYWRIFQKFFKVSRMGERSNSAGIARGENSVRDIRVFLALLDALVTGKVVFDPETNTLEAGISFRQRQLLEEFEITVRQHIEAEDMDAPGTTISLADEVYVMLEKVFGYTRPTKRME